MANKTIEYYLSLPYRIEVYPDEEGNGYTAIIPDLPGCMTSADTLDELWEMIEEAKELWLEVALEDNEFIPEPSPVEVEEYSGKFIVRVPRSLHRQLVQRAKLEDTSLNQLVLLLLSDSMGRWTERRRQAFLTQYRYAHKPFQLDAFVRLFHTIEKPSLTPATYYRQESSFSNWPEIVPFIERKVEA